MNKYLKNLNKIEFALTYACTGSCKHCSEGSHTLCGDRIDSKIAASSVRKIASEYAVKTVMVFGGEPLLHVDAVCEIMTTAMELDIPQRQIITNGYFSQVKETVSDTVKRLSTCGINDLLLSVDAFHQETIPLNTVMEFALEAVEQGIPVRLQPAWLVSRNDDNPFNRQTRAILDSFSKMNVQESEGNIIFPKGNALLYLAEYFKGTTPENPYEEDPFDVKCISFSPNGDVLDGNVYRLDVMEIINNYKPSGANRE